MVRFIYFQFVFCKIKFSSLAKKAAFHSKQSAPAKAMDTINGFMFDRPCSTGQLDRLICVFKGERFVIIKLARATLFGHLIAFVY